MYFNGTDLIYGTTDGKVFFAPKANMQDQKLIFVDKQGRCIVDLFSSTASEPEFAIVVKKLENGDFQKNTEAFLVTGKETAFMGEYVSKLLSTRCVLQYDNQLFSVYFPHLAKIIPCYFLEFFYGTDVYDFDGQCLAINRSMASAVIYTFDLTSSKSVDERATFSFEGPYLSQIGDEDAVPGSITYKSFDDLDEENLRNEAKFHSMIDSSLVLQVHYPRTYIDFVKIVKGIYSESIVISGGRDHKVVISTFFSHKVLVQIDCDDMPCCGTYDGNRYFYFGCNDGQVGIIDLHDSHFKCRFVEVGEARIRKVRTSPDGLILVALNFDNVLLSLNCREMTITEIEQYDESVLDFYPVDNENIVVLCKDGTFYRQN
jgi:hypothetical protein